MPYGEYYGHSPPSNLTGSFNLEGYIKVFTFHEGVDYPSGSSGVYDLNAYNQSDLPSCVYQCAAHNSADQGLVSKVYQGCFGVTFAEGVCYLKGNLTEGTHNTTRADAESAILHWLYTGV